MIHTYPRYPSEVYKRVWKTSGGMECLHSMMMLLYGLHPFTEIEDYNLLLDTSEVGDCLQIIGCQLE